MRKAKHPLIVIIHGGPHGAQGPAFNFKSQFYAGRGYATLQVNFRGSTGYGQKFADAVFGDQNGHEAQDVLYGVSAALRRNPWIDRDRMGVEGGSYGGQLSCWLVTQTPIFKAAIPLAPIVNNLSYNYMTYYNQYEQMEWGARPAPGQPHGRPLGAVRAEARGQGEDADHAHPRRERQRRAHRGVGAVLRRAPRRRRRGRPRPLSARGPRPARAASTSWTSWTGASPGTRSTSRPDRRGLRLVDTARTERCPTFAQSGRNASQARCCFSLSVSEPSQLAPGRVTSSSP